MECLHAARWRTELSVATGSQGGGRRAGILLTMSSFLLGSTEMLTRCFCADGKTRRRVKLERRSNKTPLPPTALSQQNPGPVCETTSL